MVAAAGAALFLLAAAQVAAQTKTFSISERARAAEGASASLTITLSEDAPDAGVPFTVVAGFGGSSTAEAADVMSIDSPVTVPSGTRSLSIAIPLTDDDMDEDEETFTVTIATTAEGWMKAGDGKDTAVVAIDDDDNAGVNHIGVETISNDNGPKIGLLTVYQNTRATYQVVLTSRPVADVTIKVSGPWITVSPASHTFAASSANDWREPKQFTVTAGDRIGSSNILHTVITSDPNYSTLQYSDWSHTSNKLNLDIRPPLPTRLTLRADRVPAEGEGAVTVTATLDNPAPSGGTTVRLTPSGTAAGEGTDYTLSSTTIGIGYGQTTGTTTITVTDDSADDDGETIVLAASSRNPELTSNTLTLTIEDNDQEVEGGSQDLAPLTASFEEVPAEHAGRNKVFEFLVRFSESLGSSGRTPQASSFEVSRGQVRRVRAGGDGLWRVRVNPRSTKDVGITLAGGRDCDTEGAVCAADGRALSNTVSATVQGLPRLKVAGGRAREGTDEAIDFAVTLNRTASGTVTVDYATVDETATAGTDYTATSGTLTFAPGETEKTVRVAILDDLVDEGREIFRLKLSNAVGAHIADGKAAGRINNMDPGQAAWLSRFGRAVATGVVDALGDRIDRRAQVRSRSRTADLSLLQSFALSAVGGHSAAGYGTAGSGVTRFGAHFGGTGDRLPGRGAGPSNAMPGHHNGIGFSGDPRGGAFGGGALLGNSMPMGPAGAGADIALPTGSLYVPGGEDGRWTGWAQTSVGHFSGGPGAALALSGQMRMGIFGTDYQMGRLLAGVAVAHGRGAGNMMRAGLDRAYNAHSTLTSVHPYMAFDLSEDLTVWGQGGWGRGEMALAESFVHAEGLEQAGAYRTGNGLTMMAAGVRGGLPEVGGFQLAVKSDAFLVRTVSDAVASRGAGNLAAAEAGVSRVRAALEGSRELRFGGGRTITPSVELGVRQDGGDAETGTGLETGFGVVYADPNLGLMLDATLKLLLAHQDSRYEEWGFTGSVRFDPGVAGRGLSLTMTPSFGMASQGADRLWAMQDMGGLMPHGALPFDTGGQFAADVGYGMAGPGGRGTGTPYAGLTQSGMGYRAMRYGWRWTVDQRFNVGVEGATQDGFGGLLDGLGNGPAGLGRSGDAAHSVQVRGGVTF